MRLYGLTGSRYAKDVVLPDFNRDVVFGEPREFDLHNVTALFLFDEGGNLGFNFRFTKERLVEEGVDESFKAEGVWEGEDVAVILALFQMSLYLRRL